MEDDDDVVVIESDSEDEDVPLQASSSRPPSCRTPSNLLAMSEDSRSSSSTNQRVLEDMKKSQNVTKQYPFIRDFEQQFRKVLGVNHSQTQIMKILTTYVSLLQELVHNQPIKSRILSKSVCRNLFLFKSLSKHFHFSAYYMQKIAQLLAIYVTMELRNAESFFDSKSRIAERVVSNVNLHMQNADVSYLLKIFGYIPSVGKKSEIAPQIFKRLLPEPIIQVKHEFSDRLYVQYLIAFYHWKDSESLYEDEEKVIGFANRFMKPMHTLKSSLIYAEHLPCYEKRSEATGYFLRNMVFFNDLRNASLLDGISETVPDDVIDLSDDLDALTIDIAEVIDDDDTPVPPPPSNSESIPMELEEQAPWLQKLVRRAIELEVKLPPRLALKPIDGKVINVELSDEEQPWSYNEQELKEKYTNLQANDEAVPQATDNNQTNSMAAPDGDINSVDSFQNIYAELNMSVDVPEESGDVSLRQLSEENEAPKTNSLNGARLTFTGITENELNCLPSSSSAIVEKSTLETENEPHSIMEESSESSIVDPEPTPETASSIESTAIEETIIQKEASNKMVYNDDISDENETKTVANILAGFAQGVTSLTNDSSDTAVEQPAIFTEHIVNGIQVEKEAITLGLNPYTVTYESSQESVETFPSNQDDKPQIKTYVRTTINNGETTTDDNETSEDNSNFNANSERVDDENNTIRSDAVSSQETQKTNKETPHILFSGKVISLQEDDMSSGGLTPNYLNVPESVEVSPRVSTVVFSMQGRRLSSFPPLQMTSPNEPGMPDFDADFFNEAEEIVANRAKKADTTEKILTPATKDKAKDVPPKPAAGRRSVRWSDQDEIRVIPPRETYTPSFESTQSAINNITSAINNNNATRQHFQQSSTTISSSQPDINANKLATSSTSTNIQKRTIPQTATNTIATASPGAMAIKTAREKVLIRKLFPELFEAKRIHDRMKLLETYNVEEIAEAYAALAAVRPIINKKVKKVKSKSNASITSNTTRNDNNRRKSVTHTTGKKVFDFDKYLENLEKKKARIRSKSSATNGRKKRERSRKSRNKNNVFVDRDAKTFVDIASDEKLKMKPVVVVERLSETIYMTKWKEIKKLKADSMNNRTSSPLWAAEKEQCTGLTHNTVSSTEYLCIQPDQEASIRVETVAEISTIRAEPNTLSDEVQQEECSSVDEQRVPPAEVIENVVPAESVQAAQIAEERAEESEDTAESIPREKIQVLLKQMKQEESDPEQLMSDNFKKPKGSYISNGARSPYIREFKSSPAMTLSYEFASTSIESPTDRLTVEQSTQQLDKNLPPNNTEESDWLQSTDSSGTPNQQPETSDIEKPPTREVKVKLKRCNLNQRYFVVANTAVDDMIREGKDPLQLDNVNIHSRDEKKSRKEKQKKGSAARKREAMKRIYHESPNINTLFLGPRNRRTFGGESSHLSCINTPPPTPPSPSLSPGPQSVDTNPTTDDTSQDGSEMGTHRFNAELNNNNVRTSFPPLSRQNRIPSELSNYLLSRSELYQEFCDYANVPREEEVSEGTLVMFNEYLAKRTDDPAMFEISRMKLLLETKSYRQRRRFDPCSSPSLSQQRTSKFSTSDSSAASGSSWGCKRRKSQCSDSQSPDFLLDEDICSSPVAANSPTTEVMRLHSKPLSTTISSTVFVSKQEKQQIEVEVHTEAEQTETTTTADDPDPNPPIQSRNQFTECSSSTKQIATTTPTPVQSELYMKNEEEAECGRSSSLSRRTNCESPLEIASRIAVSRTYSKSNMVQHVFVPPEIEKYIEEQSSTGVIVDKNEEEQKSIIATTIALPSTSKRHGSKARRCSGRKKRKIPKYIIDNNTGDDDDDDDDNDEDYDIEEEKSKEMRANAATTRIGVKRTRRKTKSSHRRKKLRKH